MGKATTTPVCFIGGGAVLALAILGAVI